MHFRLFLLFPADRGVVEGAVVAERDCVEALLARMMGVVSEIEIEAAEEGGGGGKGGFGYCFW